MSSPSNPDGASAKKRDDASGVPTISVKNMIWPVLLGLLVLGGIAYFTFDLQELRALPLPNLWFMGLALGMTGLQIFFGGWRFSFVAQERFGLIAGMRFQLAWQFFSNLTPSAVGGGPASAYYMARDQNITVGDSTALMLFTILLDQLWFAFTIPVLLIGSLYLTIVPPALGSIGVWTIFSGFIGLMCWSAAFAYTTLVRPNLLRKLADWIFRMKYLRRFRERVAKEMHQLARRAKTLRMQKPSFYLKGFLITAGLWFARYLLIVCILFSFFPDLDSLLAVVRSAAMLLVALVLPTPGGAGGLEGLYAIFMAPLIPSALLAPTLLVWRILGYYIFIGLGVYLSVHHAQQAIKSKSTEHKHASPSDSQTQTSPIDEVR